MKKRKKLGAERLSEFFRQFSVLVESGLSIPETLEIMQQDDTTGSSAWRVENWERS